jgi:transposase
LQTTIFNLAPKGLKQVSLLFRRRIHANTVRNRLKEVGLKCRRPKKAVQLTLRHKRERLRWARAHLRMTRRQWGRVLFSDESKIMMSRADGRARVWRRRNERFAEACVQPFDRWGGGSIHVWAGISQFGRTDLVIFDRNVNAQTYVQDVLTPAVVPYINQHFHGHGTLQHDNARPHTARVTRNFLAANHINVLDWPAMSPDMSPIEHLWDELKRRIYARVPQPLRVQDLRQAAIQEWNNIPQAIITRVVISMRQRCQALINARGSYTRY